MKPILPKLGVNPFNIFKSLPIGVLLLFLVNYAHAQTPVAPLPANVAQRVAKAAALSAGKPAEPSADLQAAMQILSAQVPQTTDQHLRLRMELDTINYDETYIGFNSAASTAYVFNEDAVYKAGNSAVNLCTISSDNVDLAINESGKSLLTF